MKKSITFMKYFTLIISIGILVFIDQFTKILATNNFANGQTLPIIDNVLELTYLQNYGAAFGMLEGQKYIFLIVTLIVSIMLVYEYHHTYKTQSLIYNIIYIMLLSGALGNAIDRFYLGYVRDFIYFKIIDFPVFNIADCYVTLSTIAIIVYDILLIKNHKNDYTFLSYTFSIFDKKREKTPTS